MKGNHRSCRTAQSISCIAIALLTFGAATASAADKSKAKDVPGKFAVKYRATDDRVITIGPSKAADAGWTFKNPHMEKCWILDGFDFNGYDTLYIAPTLSTAKLAKDAGPVHEIAKDNLVVELRRSLASHSVFANVMTREGDIKPGARVLKMENTITEFSKGGGAARFWAGEFGAGQPVLRVSSKVTDGDKVVATCELRRSGASARARMLGGTMTDEEVQIRDIRSLTLDYSDFIAAIAGKYKVEK